MKALLQRLRSVPDWQKPIIGLLIAPFFFGLLPIWLPVLIAAMIGGWLYDMLIEDHSNDSAW